MDMSTWAWTAPPSSSVSGGIEGGESEENNTSSLEMRMIEVETQLRHIHNNETVNDQPILEQILERLLKIEATQHEILTRLDVKTISSNGSIDNSAHYVPPTTISTNNNTIKEKDKNRISQGLNTSIGGIDELDEAESSAPEMEELRQQPLRRLSVEERKLILNFRNRNGSSASIDDLNNFNANTMSSPGNSVKVKDEEVTKTNRLATDELCAILGFPRTNELFSKKKWELVRTGQNVHIWLSNGRTDGILIKGGTFTSANAKTLANWLIEENFFTAIHGITHATEVLKTVDKSTIRRITSVKTGLVISSKREFIVCTTQTEVEGAIVFTTRSLSDDNKYPPKKGYTRGFIYTSGFIIRPVKNTELTGCEIQFAIHLDMRSSSGRSNSARVDPLVKSLVNMTDNIRHGHSTKLIDNHLVLKKAASDCTLLAPEEHDQLKEIAARTVNNLRKLYESDVLAGPPSMDTSPGVWNNFYDKDGIIVSECATDVSSTGTLRASCTTDASPASIRHLLMNKAEAIDGLLEKKYLLSQLDVNTIVQLLAYGPIWPVGARDYLIVTSDVSYPTPLGEGFIIASTSIDDICEEEDEVGHTTSKYTRSSMKLAGYVGVPNASGGTDLKLFVDIDVYSYVPTWLVQILAQYGLSEMMNRIRLLSIGQRVLIRPFQLDKIVDKLKEKGADTPDKVQKRMSRIILKEERRKSMSIVEMNFATIAEVEPQSQSPLAVDIGMSSVETGGGGFMGVGKVSDVIQEEEEDEDDFCSVGSHNELTIIEDEVLLHAPIPVIIPQECDEKGKAVATEAVRLHHLYLSGMCDAGTPFDWVEKMNRKGVAVHASAVTGSTWLAIKANTIVMSDRHTILKFLLEDANVGSYDDMFDTAEHIKKVNDKTMIRRMKFKAIWPTAPRDFLACTTWSEALDGTILVSTRSAPDDFCPRKSDYVRGNIVVSGYRIQSRLEGGCDLCLIAHTELGGTLPVSIINMLSATAPFKMLTAISEILRRP